jgi:uncharacterized membrane protein
VLGVALGGFFDGILLHQVLQWHHLLSLVPGESLRRIETQILADGAFHVLMYGVAVLGLCLLWRARNSLASPGGGRRLLTATLLGFGAWNVVDVVLFHWILHIHRIRVDVPEGDRLRWDLLWLALFAVPPLLGAWAVRRGGRRGGGPRGAVVASLVAVLVVGSAGLSLRAPAGADGRVVLFQEGVAPEAMFRAVAAVDGRVVWTRGRLVAVQLPPGAHGWALYRHGALAVGGPGSPAGCLTWSRV